MSANLKRLLLTALVLGLALSSSVSAVPAAVPKAVHDQYLRFTPVVLNQVLAANTMETVTVPALCDFMVFGSMAIFYVRSGGNAAVPADDVTDGTGSEISPAVKLVVPGETFTIIAPATTVVSMACYDLQ